MAFKTFLVNLGMVGFDEFEFAYGLEITERMFDAEQELREVSVTAVGVDNGQADQSYYDVVLADGTRIDMLSGHHIHNVEAVHALLKHTLPVLTN